MTMNDSSHVAANTSGREGGGVFTNTFHEVMTLSDDAAVSGNSAVSGGRIFSLQSTVLLRNAATVTGNTATGGSGGGISLFSGTLNACDSTLDEWVGAISPNTPDDPPAPTVVTCA